MFNKNLICFELMLHFSKRLYLKWFKKFNNEKYLAANPDVKLAVDRKDFLDGLDHYIQFGFNENRGFIKKLTRNDKVFSRIDKSGVGLEIGPNNNPIAPKKEGFKVDILDRIDTQELRNSYPGNGKNIEEVDYVWRGEPFQELIGKNNYYDWIIASHVIEHVPDMVSFLNQCSILLKENGKISLIIPDKRYCFDYFLPISTSGDFIDKYYEKAIKPTPGQIFDHFSNASSRFGSGAWQKDKLGEPNELSYAYSKAKSEFIEAIKSDKYCDVHCSRFTPISFQLIISDLFNLGLIDLKVSQFYDTEGCEFYITLEKQELEFDSAENRLNLLKAIEVELRIMPIND